MYSKFACKDTIKRAEYKINGYLFYSRATSILDRRSKIVQIERKTINKHVGLALTAKPKSIIIKENTLSGVGAEGFEPPTLCL